MKKNILKNELRRAIRNGSDEEQKEIGIEAISTRYHAYGYPSRVIRRTLRNVRSDRVKSETQEKIFISLTFMNDNAVREIRRTLHKCNLNNHVCVSFKSRNLCSILRKSDERTCKCKFCVKNIGKGSCYSKNVVYRIECTICKAFYIGETTRTMRSRLREHLSVPTSNVFEHLLQHHVIPDAQFIGWTVLHSGLPNLDIRRRVETSEIHSQRPTINSQNTNVSTPS